MTYTSPSAAPILDVPTKHAVPSAAWLCLGAGVLMLLAILAQVILQARAPQPAPTGFLLPMAQLLFALFFIALGLMQLDVPHRITLTDAGLVLHRRKSSSLTPWSDIASLRQGPQRKNPDLRVCALLDRNGRVIARLRAHALDRFDELTAEIGTRVNPAHA